MKKRLLFAGLLAHLGAFGQTFSIEGRVFKDLHQDGIYTTQRAEDFDIKTPNGLGAMTIDRTEQTNRLRLRVELFDSTTGQPKSAREVGILPGPATGAGTQNDYAFTAAAVNFETGHVYYLKYMDVAQTLIDQARYNFYPTIRHVTGNPRYDSHVFAVRVNGVPEFRSESVQITANGPATIRLNAGFYKPHFDCQEVYPPLDGYNNDKIPLSGRVHRNCANNKLLLEVNREVEPRLDYSNENTEPATPRGARRIGPQVNQNIRVTSDALLQRTVKNTGGAPPGQSPPGAEIFYPLLDPLFPDPTNAVMSSLNGILYQTEPSETFFVNNAAGNANSMRISELRFDKTKAPGNVTLDGYNASFFEWKDPLAAGHKLVICDLNLGYSYAGDGQISSTSSHCAIQAYIFPPDDNGKTPNLTACSDNFGGAVLTEGRAQTVDLGQRIEGFGVFPNPATDRLSIQWPLDLPTGEARAVEIFDLCGRLRGRVEGVGAAVSSLDLAGFSNGTFIARLVCEGRRPLAQRFAVIRE